MDGRGMKAWRSFTRQDPRRIYSLLIVFCVMISICFLSHVRPLYCPAPYGKPRVVLKPEPERTAELKLVAAESRKNNYTEVSFAEDDDEDEENRAIDQNRPLCHEMSRRADTCDARGDIRVKSSTNTIFVGQAKEEWEIKPYARKGDSHALKHVKQWFLKPFSSSTNNQQTPKCTITKTIPAVIFSIGGYTGNVFHDFTDVLIPLFITSHQFHGQVQLLVSDTKPWWVNKYRPILKQLSNHEIVNLDNDGDAIRCFPRVITGLHFHKELGIDSSKSPSFYSIADFRALLRKAYALERADALVSFFPGSTKRPRLLIISRRRSRSFLNEKAMADVAASLGFDVTVAEADLGTEVGKFARLVNSADVLLGVHGAGLTNMVFLPVGAVVIQVVPFGSLEWLARDTFMKPVEDLELKYLALRRRIGGEHAN
ncbi:hypothetical protein HPP92_004446 [Vanilla planifolia]|uniref:Glycosyltransferase 61 catalytic domain-containing protein n=1 Tax=Vanilla planifolia TaxID=51239 RepID=A0A835RWQ9_VANPL|nr:hypothetical protein HPP92_004446 [Vanilla planifolia]